MSNNILHRVANNEPGAVEACLDQYGGLVWSLARRFSKNAADAEDAVQEIFINLWSNAGRYDETVAKEATFVSMIARRRLIDRQRKAGRRPEKKVLSSDLIESITDGEIDRQSRDDETRRALEAIEQLRPEQRRVLQLSIGQNCTYEDIATATELPLGTVKTHARRGLIRVREILAAQRPDVDARKGALS